MKGGDKLSKINFDISLAGDCASMLCRYAEDMNIQSEKVQAMIALVESGWAGAGAAEYREYLTKLRGDIDLRARQLRELGERVHNAKEAALIADREAAKGSGGQAANVQQTAGGGQAVSGHTAEVHTSGHTLGGQNAGSKGDSFVGSAVGAVAGEFSRAKGIVKGASK